VNELKWQIAREAPHLRRFSIALTGDRDAADDLVQDCLARALRKRHLWHRRGSLRSWLFRILYRLYLDRRRAPSPEVGVPMEFLAARSVQPANQEARAEYRQVIAGLSRLPVEQRAAILTVALEGLSYDEAASALGIPIGTLRSRLSRGRETLRRTMSATSKAPPLRRIK
jgi:RNA polymerase sigma-70 factor (ECF subfamily)